MFLLVMGGVAYAEPAAPAADTAEFVEVEPNNTPAQAQSIVYGNYGYPTLSPISDIDYFKFNGAAGDIVYFGNADPCYYYGCSVKITLLDSNQTELATASLTYPQIALVTLPANGVYYLRVEDATSDPDLDTIRYSLYC
jgi:hypothetical protein